MDLAKSIPNTVVRRFPRYYRYISALLKVGISRISSMDLSKRMEITASQVRQDFSCFGGIGLQGYGYDVDSLHLEMRKIIGLDQSYKLIVLGAGNLGQALIKHTEFEKLGYKIVGVFDVNSRLVGEKIRDIEIMHLDYMPEFIKHNAIDIAVITVPGAYANEAAVLAVNHGVKGIWNFTPVDLRISQEVVIENIHLADSLMILGYRLRERFKKLG